MRLVRALGLTTFLLWAGGSAIIPLLPEYLKYHGADDGLVGLVMASYFAAALVFQYPAGWLADHVGRRTVLIGGISCYAVGSFGFLLPVGPGVDAIFRCLQGAGAGAAEVASLAMIAGAVSIDRRGRAFSYVYGSQIAGMAIGPLFGGLLARSDLYIIFVAAGVIGIASTLPAVMGGAIAAADTSLKVVEGRARRRLPEMNSALRGALLAAIGFGLIIGVYEACWTLLLQSHGAHNWQIGLSWTMFATPFAAMAKPAGWLTDHLDRRLLAVFAMASSVVFCTTYPFVGNLWLLLALGGLEAIGVSVGMPAIQSLLTQGSRTDELGRVQGLFSTCETGAIAVSAAAGGALFGIAIWAPFVGSAAGCLVVVVVLPFIWSKVAGRVRDLMPEQERLGREVPTVLNA